MGTLNHNINFQVSLSNGETFFEGKGIFKPIPGELSPWQILQRYLIDNKVSITSMALYSNDGHVFNLPSIGKNSKFQPALKGTMQKPIDYHLFRYIERDVKGVNNQVGSMETVNYYTVAVAIYSNCQLQLWVDETNPKNCWVAVHTQ